MKRAQLLLLLGVLVSYFLPWKRYDLEFSGPPGFIPRVTRWEYVSGVTLTIDLGRAAAAQWSHQSPYNPLRPNAWTNGLLCVAHVFPFLAAVVLLVKFVLRKGETVVPVWLAAALGVSCTVTVLVAVTFLSEFAFRGAEWVGMQIQAASNYLGLFVGVLLCALCWSVLVALQLHTRVRAGLRRRATQEIGADHQ